MPEPGPHSFKASSLPAPNSLVVVHFLVSLHKNFSIFILIFLLDTLQGLELLGKERELITLWSFFFSPQFISAFHTKNSFSISSEFSSFLILRNNIKLL